MTKLRLFCFICFLLICTSFGNNSNYENVTIILQYYSNPQVSNCSLESVFVIELGETIYLMEMTKNLHKNESNNVNLTTTATATTPQTCLYQQRYENISRILVLNIHADETVNGLFAIENMTFHAENAIIIRKNNQKEVKFIYGLDNVGREGHCGVITPTDTFFTENETISQQKEAQTEALKVNYANVSINSYYVELFLVTDQSFYNKHKGNTVNYLFEVVNYVNAVYRAQGIHIIIVGMELLSTSNSITTSTSSDSLLTNLRNYRTRMSTIHDNLHMINGFSYDSNVLGLAFLNGMCLFSYSLGITSDYKSQSPLTTALTMAHEIGHNFGLNHDKTTCTCSPDQSCIMNAYAKYGVNPLRWSDCSLAAMHTNLQSGSSSYCLNNSPNLQSSPALSVKCGNGIVDANEDCDPGLLDTSAHCCNARTCKFNTGAVCASGRCCDKNSCQFVTAGVICRDLKDECDLKEYCTGDSEYCPANYYKRNGVRCNNNLGTCYNGFCGSHDKQCKLLYGSTSEVANDVCFEQNLPPSYFSTGYCQYKFYRVIGTSVQYLIAGCSSRNKKCGVLHCKGPSKPLWASAMAYYSTIKSGSVCNHMVHDVNLTDLRDPGLVPNGAFCGTNEICVDSECLPMNVLSSTCNCSNQGVCNNLNHCDCNSGYSGSLCEIYTGGCGGSVDSGPNCEESRKISTTKSPQKSSSDNSSPSVGVVVAIIIGSCIASIVFIVLVIVLLCCCCKSRHNKSSALSPPPSAPPVMIENPNHFLIPSPPGMASPVPPPPAPPSSIQPPPSYFGPDQGSVNHTYINDPPPPYSS